jgi:hypothetical protein
VPIAREWLETVDREMKAMEREGKPPSTGPTKVLKLKKDKTIGWEEDVIWDETMQLAKVIGVI